MINYYLVQFIPSDMNDYYPTDGPVPLGVYDSEEKAQQYISSSECSADLKKEYLNDGHIEITPVEFNKPFTPTSIQLLFNQYHYDLNEETVILGKTNVLPSCVKPPKNGSIYALNEEEALAILKQFKEKEAALKLTGYFEIGTGKLWFEQEYLNVHRVSNPCYSVEMIRTKDEPPIRTTYRYVWPDESFMDKKDEIIKELTLEDSFIKYSLTSEDFNGLDNSFKTEYS